MSPAELASRPKAKLILPSQSEAPKGMYLPSGDFVKLRALSGAGASKGVKAIGLKAGQQRDMKVVLGQIEVKAGMPDANVAEMLKVIKQAKKSGADMVVFPEMCVGGYMQGDAWRSDANCEDLMGYNAAIKAASKGIAVVWGNICLDDAETMAGRGVSGYHPNKDGSARRYNAIYVAQDGKWAPRAKEHSYLPKGVQAKTLLPNYGFFDDERYFFSLADVATDFGCKVEDLQQPFKLKVDGKDRLVGVTNCEDMWCQTYRQNGAALNPTKMVVENGAERVINISSSPWAPGKEEARDEAVKFLKKDLGDAMVPFYYCSHTGEMNNGKNFIPFDGGSRVYNADGQVVMAADGMFESQALVVSDVQNKKPIEATKKNITAQKVQAIIRGIRHLKESSGFKEQPRFVIGLSGGIDSALSAALLHLAMKDEPDAASKIVGLNMPTKYNSEKTKGAAKALADKLGIQYHIVPIEEPADVIRKAIADIPVDGKTKPIGDLTDQNLQAKVRGCDIQSNLAQHIGGVFVNNGNKLEVALGYATLYGDWGGAMSILGDLTKSEVYEVAKYLNEEVFGEEVIPNSLIPDELYRFGEDQIKPSAELKNEQVDPIKIGYHCALLDAMTSKGNASPQDFLRWFRDGTLHKEIGISVELMKRYGMDDPKAFVEDLDWFSNKVATQVFKRVQSPPIILVSSSAYGYDIRESILPYRETKAAKAIKQDILDNLAGYQPKIEAAA